jgi:hypothetical protein
MTLRTTLFTAIALGFLLLAASARAQSAVSEKDRAEISALVSRYAEALSSCAADEYAGLFTADGTFTSDDFRGAKHREMYGQRATLRGRDQLVQLVRTEEFCLDGRPRQTAAQRPAPAVTIQPSPEGARGSAPIGSDGRYDDVYVKTAQGWRFKSRTVTMPSVTAPGR